MCNLSVKPLGELSLQYMICEKTIYLMNVTA